MLIIVHIRHIFFNFNIENVLMVNDSIIMQMSLVFKHHKDSIYTNVQGNLHIILRTHGPTIWLNTKLIDENMLVLETTFKRYWRIVNDLVFLTLKNIWFYLSLRIGELWAISDDITSSLAWKSNLSYFILHC